MLVLLLLLLLCFHASGWERAEVVLVVLAADALLHGLWVWQARRIPIAVGPEALVGQPVTALSQCRPYGRVRLGGEYWSARCPGGAEAGERLVVAAVEAITLVVRRPEWTLGE